MRKYIRLLLPLIFISECGIAQQLNSFPAPNSVYIEGLGSGGLYSVNFDRVLLVRAKNSYGIRLGFGAYGKGLQVNKIIGQLYTITGTKNHHAEFGLGGVLGNRINLLDTDSGRDQRFHFTPSLGYRYQEPAGGIVFRIGFVPFIAITGETPKRVFPWGGVSIGRSF